MSGIIIVGAGQAGASLAAKLRSSGFDGPLTLIGEEPVEPYQRPPLSKAYLLGEMDIGRLFLRGAQFWDEQKIDLRLSTAVSTINREQKTIDLGGETLSYDHLALTTGAVPRRLPASVGGDLAGIYTVRTLADADAMRGEFQEGRKVLIVGGGYIGLEAAAVAAKNGLDVTVVEMAPRVLSRVAASETSDYFRQLHLSNGVTLLENIGLETLTGNERVSGATLSNGMHLDVDFVIVGTGIVPNQCLAEASGLNTDNGIVVDKMGRTSDPYIWAAGDCAIFPHNGDQIRLESVGNAIAQAEAVAQNMLGANKPYEARPWFWSDQYDVKLQIAGLNKGYDRIVTRVSNDDEAVASFWYYRGDSLLAIDAMNDARAYMIGKRLIEAGKSPDPERVSDANIDLKELL